jgi:hypothetical protein
MPTQKLLVFVCLLLGCSAHAETTAEPRSLLPSKTKIIEQKEVELDGSAPIETSILYRYTKDKEDYEELAFYKPGCGLVWRSGEALSSMVAPSFETKDLTGDNLPELLVYQSVHGGQEFLVHIYQMSGCVVSEVLSDFTYPASAPQLQSKPEGNTLTFSYMNREACETSEEDPGFIHTYAVKQNRFDLIENKVYQRIYPLFEPHFSGGEAATRAAKQLGDVKIFDHLAADFDKDGREEVIFLYEKGGLGALIVLREVLGLEKVSFTPILSISLDEDTLSLDGAIKNIALADVTGDANPELIIDSYAQFGCALDTWVIQLSNKEPQLLLQLKRPLKEPVSATTKMLSYRETTHGLSIVWRWNDSAFVGPAGEIFPTKTLR